MENKVLECITIW